jgi:hypothetical protein
MSSGARGVSVSGLRGVERSFSNPAAGVCFSGERSEVSLFSAWPGGDVEAGVSPDTLPGASAARAGAVMIVITSMAGNLSTAGILFSRCCSAELPLAARRYIRDD